MQNSRNLFYSIITLAVFALATSFPTYAQSARSLFSNSSGVTFNAKSGEVSDKAISTSGASQKESYSGLRYELLQEFPNGEVKKVSPNKTFKDGDRIKVILSSNKTGELSVVNIDPQGKPSLLMEKRISAGENINVPTKGFLKFVGEPGVEQLIFALSAKSMKQKAAELGNPMTTIISSCFRNQNTRSLAIEDSAGNQSALIDSNGKCAESNKATTRSLVVDVSEDSGYAVIPDNALAEGQILTLKINLRHN